MFTPNHGSIANELCSESANWTLDTGQLLDGTLRLSPTVTKYESGGSNMVEGDWDTIWDFEDGTADSWHIYGNYVLTDGKLRLHAETRLDFTDEWQFTYGAAHMQDVSPGLGDINNTTGWSIEFRVACEGISQFTIGDGEKYMTGWLGVRNGVSGIWLNTVAQNHQNSTGEFIMPLEGLGGIKVLSSAYTDPNDPSVLIDNGTETIREYKTVRFSVQGGDLTIDEGDQEVHLEDTQYLKTGVVKGVWFAIIGEQQKWRYRHIFWESVYRNSNDHGRADLWLEYAKVSDTYAPVRNISNIAVTTWTNVTQTAYTPAYTPDPGITRFQNAIYVLENVSFAGTLYVTPQYRYDGGLWQDGSQIQLTTNTTQSIAGFLPVGDGKDAIRFKLEQASDDGSEPAPRLDSITLTLSRADNGVYTHNPAWGTKIGENTVAFDIIKSPTDKHYNTGDVFILDHDASGVSDEGPNAFSPTTSGTVRTSIDFVELYRLENDITGTDLDSILATSTSPVGDGLTSVGSAGTDVVLRRNPTTMDTMYMQEVIGVDSTKYVGVVNFKTLVIGTKYVIEFALNVVRGGTDVRIVGITNGHYYLGSTGIFRMAFKATATQHTINFHCLGDSKFYFGGFRLYSGEGGAIDVGTQTEINSLTAFNVHSKVYMQAYPVSLTGIIGNLNSVNMGWLLGIEPNGLASLRLGGIKYEGEIRVPLNQWTTVSARIESNFAQLLVNGECAGVFTLSAWTLGNGDTYIGNDPTGSSGSIFPGAIADTRISDIDWSAKDIAYNYVQNMLPTFQTAYEPELDSDTLIYLMFNQSRGLIENKGTLYDPIIPDKQRHYVYRGVNGVVGQGIRVRDDGLFHGYLRVPMLSSTSWMNTNYAIEAAVVWQSNEYAHQTLISVGSLSDTGFQIRQTPDGFLQYHYKDAAGERTLTSDTEISSEYSYKHFSIVHDRSDNTVEMFINGVDVGTLASDTTGDMSTAPNRMFIGDMAGTGEPSVAAIDNFKAQANVTSYTDAYPFDSIHWSPTETVYVDGEVLHADRVSHVSPYRKLVVMPAHTPRYVNTKIVGSEFLPTEPYNYVYNYHVQIDTGEYEGSFGSTRSPFRVMHEPHEHAVKIALVGTSPLSVETHMSVTDLSDREPANRTGYGVPINTLRGDIGHSYDDAADTDEILVSNKSAMWQAYIAPKPLFYKYLVGRGRFYVYVPTASTPTDIEPIRQAISVNYINNEEIGGIWDIEISSLDYYGETLPANVYSVILLLEKIPEKTMWVNYPSVPFRNLTANSDLRKEIVNPVPLFEKGSGRMKFTTTLNELGSYDVEVDA